jgi:SOS-response transcriptional repressor LexA
MSLGEAVKIARAGRGMTQADLADVAGISRTHLLNIEKGHNVTVDVLMRIANALGLSITDLLIDSDSADNLHWCEEHCQFRANCDHSAVRGQHDAYVTVPVYGEVAAGTPIDAVREGDCANIPANAIEFGEYVLRARGASMVDAGIDDGDLLVVQPRPAGVVRTGELVIALLNGGITVKRWWRKGGVKKLIPANPDYNEIVLSDDDDFRLQGVVTSVIKPR